MSRLEIRPEQWPSAIAETDGPQIVVGGPGTGKTEFLVRRATHLIRAGIDPGEIVVLGFSRRGAADIRNRIERELDDTTAQVSASTFHSLALRILETHGSNSGLAPNLLTANEQVAFVADLLSGEDRSDWAIPYRPILQTSRFAQEVSDFLLRCSEQRIGPERLREFERDDWRGFPQFFDRYRRRLSETNRLDYGSLMTNAVDLLDDDAVAAALAAQFRYVLADEFQDTSYVQAQFLHGLYRHHHNLTAAADPYQSVYSFRGTDLRNVDRFPDEFPAADGSPARRIILTTSFRVPDEILRAAEALTAHLDLPGAAGPVEGVAAAGRVEAYRFDQATEEAEWVAREIERAHVADGTPYDAIAVFVRTKKRFMAELSRALERRRIPHNRPDSRLVDHPAVRIVFDLVTAACTTGADHNRAIRRLALGPLLRLSPGELHRLETRVAAGGWAAVLEYHSPEAAAIAALISSPEWATEAAAAEGLWHIWASLPQLASVANDPDASYERHGWSSLGQVLGRQFDRDPAISLRQYLGWTEKDDFEADPLLQYRPTPEPEVTLTTLHQAKGLEFDTVFIADAVEGVFPDLRSRESLLGTRHLSRSLPTDVVEYQRFRLQEETRLAYTAMTRASRRVVWTATGVADDLHPGGPSRFLDRLGGPAGRPPGHDRPVSATEAEAWLRRLAADPGAGRAARSAAISNLAAGPSWGGRHPAAIAGVLPRGSDSGIHTPGQLFLSPSQADAYGRCPRRYVFERKLGFTSGTSVHLELGKTIHEVIHQTDTTYEAPEPADALAVLDARWAPEGLGGPPWADAWLERAREMLTVLYENRNAAHELIASEHPVQYAADDVTWRGQIDRVERRNDQVWIVDYKTSRTPIPQDDAAASIQLGFYVLAAQHDPEVSRHGPIGGAELWYPACPQRRQPFATRSFDMGNLPLVQEAMAGLAADVEAERWEPVPGDACRNCSVRSSCPAVPEGQEPYLA